MAATDAAVELTTFANYEATLGKFAPPRDEVAQALDSATKWTHLRLATQAWAQYCSNEEGVGWTAAHADLATLKPAFLAALRIDPSLATKYPKLAVLLGAKKASARKAATTTHLNRKAVAAGEQPYHGAVGKKRQRAAEKAALTAKRAPPPNGTPHA
jgi:hypothetical protein